MGRFEAFIKDMAELYKRINIDVILNDDVNIIFTCYDGKVIHDIPHALCDCEYRVIRTSRDGPIDGAGTIYVHVNVDALELTKPEPEKPTITDKDQPCLVIRCTKPMEPEELDDLYNGILKQKTNGVILLPEFCAVITGDKPTEYKVLMNVNDVPPLHKVRGIN